MNQNPYFQEFFDTYQKELEGSLTQLDNLAQTKRRAEIKYVLTTREYKPQIKNFTSQKNLYRKNNEFSIEKSFVDGAT